jgi:hypothetical protein
MSDVQNVNVTNMALNVRVTTIDIPFGNVMRLTFMFFLASLIIAIPIAYMVAATINS